MKKLKNVIYVLFVIFVMISIVPKKMQNDTFFTIAGGRLILEAGIQPEEKLVWHEGLEFTNSRWLFDILITEIHNHGGLLGVYIFVVILAVIQGLLYYYVLKKITKNITYSFFMTVISMYAMQIAFSARAQLISNILLLLEFYCLEMIKSSNNIKKRYIFGLIVIPVIFANVHASTFPIYLVVFLPYIAEWILFKFPLMNSEEEKLIFDVKNRKVLLLLFIVGILEGMIVPSGVKPYSDMFKAMGGISSDFISELQPITIFDNLYLAFILIGAIAVLIFSKQKMRVSDGLFIVGFALLAMNNQRSLYYFVLVSSICFSRIVIEFLDTYEFRITSKKMNVVAIILGILIILVNFTNLLVSNISEEYIPYDVYPIKVANYINENLDVEQIRLYNHFNFGSYLELEGVKAFIDSRSGIFTEEFNKGCTVLKDWRDAAEMTKNYNDIFDKYEITHVLLYSNEPMSEFIKYDSKWQMIYQDNSFILYERVGVNI